MSQSKCLEVEPYDGDLLNQDRCEEDDGDNNTAN
jgi:hypothetical protein